MYGETMMCRIVMAALVSALVFAPFAGEAAAGVPRSALVIGNAAYSEIPALVNPVNDARDIAAKLRSLNFDVVHGEKLDQRGMEEVIREFGRRVRAVKGDALFYYAGRGA
jgi:uncharacterized caspase-like protein